MIDQSVKNDYDSPWKEVIEQFFPEFIRFFFPKIYPEIDWAVDCVFLDKELEKITQDAEVGKRIADKLVRVQLMGGEEAIIFIHVEIQGSYEKAFESRMFIYNRRIGEKYDGDVVSLAILCDTNPKYRPDTFATERWGCELNFKFPMVKLLDFQEKWDELEQHENVFAVVVMAHLKSLEVKQGNQRKYWKLELVKSLYLRGWERAIVIQLFRFVDWIITLPKELETSFWDDVKQLEKEKAMRYMTTGERIGHEKGVQQGEINKAREGVIDVLSIKFSNVADKIVSVVNDTVDPVRLKAMHHEAVRTDSLEAFEKWMNK